MRGSIGRGWAEAGANVWTGGQCARCRGGVLKMRLLRRDEDLRFTLWGEAILTWRQDAVRMVRLCASSQRMWLEFDYLGELCADDQVPVQIAL